MSHVDRWIAGQQIGLTAYWACASVQAWQATRSETGHNLDYFVERLNELVADYGVGMLGTLPPACLRLLGKAAAYLDERDTERFEQPRRMASMTLFGSEDRASPLPLIEAVAHAMLYGHGEARAILR